MRAKIVPGTIERAQRTPVIESTKKPNDARGLSPQKKSTKMHNLITPELNLGPT